MPRMQGKSGKQKEFFNRRTENSLQREFQNTSECSLSRTIQERNLHKVWKKEGDAGKEKVRYLSKKRC